MEVYFLWGGIGLLLLFLILGFVSGIIRGIKRASLHLLFLITSLVLAFFITKPITNALLGISLNIDNQSMLLKDLIIHFLKIDKSLYPESSQFLQKLPLSIASPIVFIVVALICWLVFEIIYLIVARVSFGKKKKDFQKSKPYRWFGGAVGVVEGFIFMFLLFAPLTALTKTYSEIATLPTSQVESTADTEGSLKKLPEFIHEVLPENIDSMIKAYNNSVVGKISGFGNLDYALFDGLSNFKFKGEKINIRTELLALADTYNDFVDVYNIINDKKYPDTIEDLKDDFLKVINKGIFKTAVPTFFKEYLLSANIDKTDLPAVAKDIAKELKKTIKDQETKEIYQDLKHDLSTILTATDDALSSGLVKELTDVKEQGTDKVLKILEIINDKNKDDTVSVKPDDILTDVFDLNILKKCITPILNFASDKISDMLTKEDSDLEFGINTTITSEEVKDTLSSVLDLLEEIKNCKIDIFELIKSDDIMNTLNNMNLTEESLSTALDQMGTILDDASSMKIFNFKDSKDQEQNLFKNFLLSHDFDILKDNVIDGCGENGKKDDILTYSEFFAYIKTPVVEANNLGLLNINGDDFDINNIIKNVIPKLDKTNKNYLSNVILPFKDLTALSLNEKVFSKIISSLEDEQLGLFDFKDVENWEQEFSHLEGLLITLSDKEKGMIQDESYLDYILKLKKNADYSEILKNMPDSTIDEVIDQVFETKIFKPLVKKIFKSFDDAVVSATKETFETDITNLDNEKAEVSEILKSIVKIALKKDNLEMMDFGRIVDLIKPNAEKQGVFFNAFENIVWFMTGDDINPEGSYVGKTPENDYYEDVKKYIENHEETKPVNYYKVEYENVLSMLDLAKDLSDSIKDLGGFTEDNATEQAGKYAENLSGVIDEMLENQGKDEVLDKLNDLNSMIKDNENIEDILGSEITGDNKSEIGDKIDEHFKDNPEYQDVADALKQLLGIGNSQP